MNKTTCQSRLVERTSESLRKGRVVAGGSSQVVATVLPVAPDSDVPQILVVSAVLQVFRANDAVPSAGIDDVVERNGTGLALLAQPGGRDGSVVGVATFELNLGDFGLLEDGGTLRLGMAEHDLVSLGTDLETTRVIRVASQRRGEIVRCSRRHSWGQRRRNRCSPHASGCST